MHSATVTGVSPSFTTHSSNNLADVAARVVEEFRQQNGGGYDDIFNFNDSDYDNTEFSVIADENADTISQPEKTKDENDCDHDNDDDDEFEFAVVSNSSTVSANEILWPQYPLFDRSLLLDVDPNLINVVNGTSETDCKATRLPLRKLFSEDRDFGSSSSSEADDLDGISPGTYCVWKPKTHESPGRCNKSNSTGNSSRRWKFRDILYRSNSNSDGKETETPFLLFKPLIASKKKINNEKVGAATVGDGEKKNPANKGGNNNRVDRRRQSYLPPGQALANAFTTTVSLSNRNLHLF